MAEPFLGQLMTVGFNFAPRGWALCNGQILSITQNTALFSLLGTTYGGNGQSTFALPNLQGRSAIHFGQGPGLSSYVLGEVTGTESETLLVTQIPQHFHGIQGAPGLKTTNRPVGAVNARGGNYSTSPSADSAMLPTQPTGGNQPHNNIPPILVLNWVIALEGIFPSRN